VETGGGVLVRTVRNARRDRIGGAAAEIAFFLLLAIPPALLILAGTAGYVDDLFGSGARESLKSGIVDGLGNFLQPETMSTFVRPAVDELFARGRADVLSLGAVLALWSASRVTRVTISAMNVAYGVPERRSAWRRRAVALGVTFVGLVTLAVALPFIVAGPRLGEAIANGAGLPHGFAVAWKVLYWPVAAVLGISLLATVYNAAPSTKTSWRHELPGAVLAAGTWVAAALGLRAYAAVAFGRGEAYGPLTAPIILLLWFWLSAIAVLLGAELNAELDRGRTTTPNEAPLD
jgi:membrane protein